jgi:phosphatidylinositol glycan class B
MGAVERAGLAALVLLAIALRVEPILIEPSTAWADEIFQAAEPAHRLVFGSGLVAWEFELGVRSWLLPGVVAGLMEVSRIAGDGPDYYLPVIAFGFAALGAAPVLCCYLWCRRWFGIGGGFLGASVVAIAPELVYFGGRTLCEVVAGHLLVVAIYLLEPGCRSGSLRRLSLGGGLLALVAVIRVQLAPAIFVVALWAIRRAPRDRIAAMLGGAFLTLGAAAFLDALTLGYPFASIWRYALYNGYYGVSSAFGVEPWDYYLRGELEVWGAAIATFALLAIVGARRMPLLLALAAIILVSHSAIPHKEPRFIYPAVVLLAVLAGLGLAELAGWARDWLIGREVSRTAAAFVTAAFAIGWWGAASVQVWTGPTLAVFRQRMHDPLVAASFVRRGPAPCGVGLYGMDGYDWLAYGGHTHFHRPAPLYWPRDEAALIAAAVGFDTLLYTRPPPAALGFMTSQCFGTVCVARRSEPCRPVAMAATPFPEPLVGMARARLAADR